MRIGIDDWHFREDSTETLVLDVYLDNGQHAVMEVNPMCNREVTNGAIPEVIVFCEYPGEKVSETECPARWVYRPPTQACPWSHVEIPLALTQQIDARLASTLAQPVSLNST